MALTDGNPRLRPTEVATDTETSGLYADDGARTSTASVAWVDWSGGWASVASRAGVALTYAIEEIAPGYEVAICSLAWPFDQGVEGKPEDTNQLKLDLFPNAANLGADEWGQLLDWLSQQRLIMHPLIFDCEKYRVGVRRWPEVGVELVNRVVWDTQNACDMLWPLHLTALKTTANRIWPERGFKDEQAIVKAYLKKQKLPPGRWDLVPWDVIGTYADLDARLTLMLYLRQQWEIDQRKAGTWLGDPGAVRAALDRRLDTARSLYRMERRGLPYDEVGSTEAAVAASRVQVGIAKQLPFAPKEAKSFFFIPGYKSRHTDEPGLELVPYQLTEQGAPSMTAEVLGRMVEDEVPHAQTYADWAKIDTARTMWYEGYAAKTNSVDGRLRMRFKQNGTKSTRFSASRVNLQAIPHDYRMSGYSEMTGIPSPRQLIASAVAALGGGGWRLYELDLQQAELRIGAMYSRCMPMLDMMESGQDLHAYTTAELFHVTQDAPNWGQLRQVGKRGNFSLGFGAGAKTFRGMISKETGMRLPEPESFRIVRDWNRLFPEWGRAIKKHEDVVARRIARHGYGWVALENGERRWFQSYEEPHKSFNQRVQSDLAQFGVDWLLAADRLMIDSGLDETPVGGAGLLLTIHDSLNLLVPDDEWGSDLVEQAAQIGRDLWKVRFPDVSGGVDVKSW